MSILFSENCQGDLFLSKREQRNRINNDKILWFAIQTANATETTVGTELKQVK
jgi:hypothetical protein